MIFVPEGKLCEKIATCSDQLSRHQSIGIADESMIDKL
jgi:hypothetical protein